MLSFLLTGGVWSTVGGPVQLAVERVDEFVDGELELVEPAVECVGAAVLGASGVGDAPGDRPAG